MYLSALHVLHPSSGEEGINAFCYRHGRDWLEPPTPEQDAGTLVDKRTPIRPGGNRVRAYLDLVMPDNASWEDIREAVKAGLARTKPPMDVEYGGCRVRFALEDELRPAWLSEFRRLFEVLEGLHRAAPRDGTA